MVARNVTGEDHHDRLCETGLERWGRFGPIACERNDRRKSMMKMYVSDITLGFGNPDGVVTITAFDESSPRITFSVTIRDIRDITIFNRPLGGVLEKIIRQSLAVCQQSLL